MGFLRISGSFSNWSVYRKAVIICDVTEMFIRRAFTDKTRTVDQMRQAARSCKQNIVEGASDKAISMEMCIKLIGVARASNRELREDYLDFLRQNGLEIWPHDDQRIISTRNFLKANPEPEIVVEKCRERRDETVANIMLTVIHQMDTLLGYVMKDLEAEFIKVGGIKEAMSRSRREQRGF